VHWFTIILASPQEVTLFVCSGQTANKPRWIPSAIIHLRYKMGLVYFCVAATVSFWNVIAFANGKTTTTERQFSWLKFSSSVPIATAHNTLPSLFMPILSANTSESHNLHLLWHGPTCSGGQLELHVVLPTAMSNIKLSVSKEHVHGMWSATTICNLP
jgi:hypothetical protein